jgi:hypothetical protein
MTPPLTSPPSPWLPNIQFVGSDPPLLPTVCQHTLGDAQHTAQHQSMQKSSGRRPLPWEAMPLVINKRVYVVYVVSRHHHNHNELRKDTQCC